MSIKTGTALLVFLVANLQCLFSQNVNLPQQNQRSTIAQKMGLAKVTIDYSSMPANNQKQFGNTVAYDKFWNAGFRENFTIEFTHDVLINGEKIMAGKYGFFLIPGKEKFQLLFSKYNRSWSQTFPNEEETVLKVSAAPNEIPFQEWLKFDFTERAGWQTMAVMEWEEIRVPFKIEVIDPNKVLYESLLSEMRGRGQFLWGANYDAANALYYNDMHLDKALEWVNESLMLEGNDKGWRRGSSQWLKSKILIKTQGYNSVAKKCLHEAADYVSNPFDLNNIVMDLVENGDFTKGLESAKRLVSEFSDDPFIWAFNATLAETYLANGNKRKALEYFKRAKENAPKNKHEYFDKNISEINKN